MKNAIAALFAGTLALSSMSVLAADPATTDMKADQPKAETKMEKTEDYVKQKAHNAKVKTKKAAKKTKAKVKKVVAERKTTDPTSVNESKPDAATPK